MDWGLRGETPNKHHVTQQTTLRSDGCFCGYGVGLLISID